MLVKLFIRHGVRGLCCAEPGAVDHFKLGSVVSDFITGLVVVPLAHDLFGGGVVQGGEGVVGQLANQVLGAVDFKRVVHSGLGYFTCACLVNFCNQFFILFFTRK